MKIMVLTTLFPNAQTPSHGVFVENRLRAFLKDHDADIKVIAPVPWFPFKTRAFGKYADWARAPYEEIRHGVQVFHPRYFLPPKVGMGYAPHALERCFTRAARGLIAQGWDFDLIDAHYFYPDGVAAARTGKALGKPVIITGRGTDINLIPQFARQKEMIIDAAKSADAVITVAQALKTEMVSLGAPPEKITVLRNGVDLDLFSPLNREAIRRSLALSGKTVLSAGHLIDRKGHDLVIEALACLPETTLLIAGDGPNKQALKACARDRGVADRVRFLGRIDHDKLAEIYNAADVLALASSREGWPNVLLEAMACGTPVVATPVWGSHEVIRSPQAGLLTKDRTAKSIAGALQSILDSAPSRKATRRYAEGFSWRQTTTGMAEIFTAIASKTAAVKSLSINPVQCTPVQCAPAQCTTGNERPKLIVTVDTEEQFDWSNVGSADHIVNDPKDIDQFQQLCAARNIKPVYFLTYPILSDAKASAYYRNLHQTSAADAGLHLHQWVTPPYDGYQGEYYSYQKNLPQDLYNEKLAMLAEMFEKIIGIRAKSHRAGRYGVAPFDYTMLARAGIDYDFSPCPGFDSSRRGGPDFSGCSNYPFSVGVNSGGVNNERRVFVTPVSAARAIPHTNHFISQEGNAPGFAAPKSRRAKAFYQPMRLSPEGASFTELTALTSRLVKDKTPVLTFTLHSTTLTKGGSPYAQSHSDVDNILETSAQYFDFFTRKLGGEIITLDQLGVFYGNNETLA